MNCQQAQDLLLTGDVPQSTALAAHLDGCAACRRTAAGLAMMDGAARAWPLPPQAGLAKARFVAQYQLAPDAPAVLSARAKSGAKINIYDRWRLHRWRNLALAASLLICMGLALWALTTGDEHQAVASEALVDRMVDWNVQLAQAQTPQQREQIFAGHATAFAQELAQKPLAADEQALAQKLASAGSVLKTNDDPLTEAESFTDIADLLLQRMNGATLRGDTKLVRRLSRNYALISAHGLNSRLAGAQKLHGLSLERQRHLKDLLGRNVQLQERLTDILEKSPAASQREILRELGLTKMPHKHAVSR